MIHSSRRKTVELFEQWKHMIDRYCLATPYQNHISGESSIAWYEKTVEQNPWNFTFKIFTPAVERAVWLSYEAQAKHQATQTVVALLRYKTEHGQFPEKLDEVVSEYLKAIPQDPFGPGPLSYKRQGDDFILYSWGLDFKDDGGKHNKEVFRQTNRAGDYVFWPPEPVEQPGSPRRTRRTKRQKYSN